MKLKIDHVNITVQNLKESIDWYKNIFEMKLAEIGVGSTGYPWAILKSNDTMVCMTERAGRPLSREWKQKEEHSINHFGFRVDDEKSWIQKVKDFNLELFYGGVNHYPHSKSWYVKDPSGHSIEVSYAKEGKMIFPKISEAEITHILFK